MSPPTVTERIGLIHNPRARAERAGQARLGPRARDLPHAGPDTPAQLEAALHDFQRDGVTLLAVQGGDGTLREVLGALPSAYGTRLPGIALLAAGKTNLAGRVLGAWGAGDAAISRLLDASAAGRLRERLQPALELRRDEHPPLRGFLFGAGAIVAAKRLADARLHRSGIHDRLAVGLALAGIAARTLLLRSDPVRRGVAMGVGAGCAEPVNGQRFLVLATPLERLMLGLWPFWGVGEGPLRWLDVSAPPHRLAEALLAARRGRPARWMPGAGYASGRADRLTVTLAEPFLLDGELFDPGPARTLALAATAPIRFVVP